MFEGAKIVIEVPFEYAQRDQLLQLMESKFPGAEILLVHAEVNNPQVSEAFVQHDSPADRTKSEPADQSQDAATVMQAAADTLSKFTKPSESPKMD
jgi:hypothetical protein